MEGHVPGSWQSQRCQASICLSWGNSVCCDWKLCLFTFTSGMCVCVWCVSWYQHHQAFLLLPPPPVSWQVFGVCHVCVRSRSFCLICTWLLPDGKSPICVSANNGLQWTTRPPRSSAHSPLLKTLKATLFCPLSSLPFPSFFLCSCLPVFRLPPVSLFCPSTQQKINIKPFQLYMTVHTCGCTDVCACLCTHREKNMKQMFR